ESGICRYLASGQQAMRAGAGRLSRQGPVATERRRRAIAAIDPHRLGRVCDVENDHAFIAIRKVKPVTILLYLMAGNHLIAAVGVLAVGFAEFLSHMLADDVKARDELRLRRRVVIEDVELLDLNLFLRFRRSAAYIDVAVVHLHAVGEAPRVEPIPKKLWVARVGHVIKRYAGKERRAGRGLARIGRNWPRAGEII